MCTDVQAKWQFGSRICSLSYVSKISKQFPQTVCIKVQHNIGNIGDTISATLESKGEHHFDIGLPNS